MAGLESVLDPDGWAFFDLVQVRTEKPFGSGLLVGQGIVLTALHCVADRENGWKLQCTIAVNLWRDLFGLDGIPPDGHSYRAKVIWPPEICQGVEPPDIAVLQLQARQDGAVPFPKRSGPLFYADLGLDKTDVVATGFPALLNNSVLLGGRGEGAFPGQANLFSLSQPTISFTSTIIAARGGWADWSGLSGGPLFRRGALVGIMRGGQPQFSTDRNLEAEPLALLLRNPAYADLGRLLGAQEEVAGPFGPRALAELKYIIEAAGLSASTVRDAYLASHLTAAVPPIDNGYMNQDLIGDVIARGRTVMSKFLTRLVNDNPNCRVAIEDWVSRQPAISGLQLKLSPSSTSNREPVVLVKVMPTAETSGVASPRQRRYQLDAWLFHDSGRAQRIDGGAAIGDAKHDFVALPDAIQALVTRSVAYLPSSAPRPVVELAMPFDLLSEAVERWSVRVGIKRRRPLGLTFPLALRSYDRLYDPQLRNSWFAWRDSWNHLPPEVNEGALHWLAGADAWGEPLFDAISGKGLVCIALVSGQTAGIGMLIEAGSPVALWLRDDPQDQDKDVARAELHRLVCGDRLGLLGRTHARRQGQAGAVAWDGMALLYDDPSRLPPDVEANLQAVE